MGNSIFDLDDILGFKSPFEKWSNSPSPAPYTPIPLDKTPENKNDKCQANFDIVSEVVFKNEGGIANDRDDKGGFTNRGISWRTWLAFAKSDLGLEPTIDNLKNLTKEQAKTIYRKRYWEAKGFCKLNNINIALMFYDFTITSGGAFDELYKLLDIEQGNEKKINDKLADFINEFENQNLVLRSIIDLRLRYYKFLSFKTDSENQYVFDENNNKIKTKNYKFLVGWQNRVANVLSFLNKNNSIPYDIKVDSKNPELTEIVDKTLPNTKLPLP